MKTLEIKTKRYKLKNILIKLDHICLINDHKFKVKGKIS